MEYNILLVDDEEDVRWLTAQYLGKLAREGYQFNIQEAADARSGLTIVSRDPKPQGSQPWQGIDLLVTDVDMPGGPNGIWLYEETHRVSPGTGIIVWSNHPENLHTVNLSIATPMAKLQRDDFLAAVRKYLPKPV